MTYKIYRCSADSSFATVEEARMAAARLKRESKRVNDSWGDRFFVGHLEEV